MSHSKNQPFAKRSLGQNFLVDETVVGNIVSELQLNVGDTLIEIGPGRGALTEKLVATGAKVIAIEIDRNFVPSLRAQFHFDRNFSVIEADVLNVGITEIVTDSDRGSVKLVGNLPYNISTAILERAALERNIFSRAVFMFQREVVDRISAKPGMSERGYFTVLVESSFEVTRLFDVAPEAFSPRPKVWSSVVKLSPKPPSAADEPAFRKLVSAAFAQKRKTILNNLKSVVIDAETTLKEAAIDPRRRAETLTLDEWLALYLASQEKRPDSLEPPDRLIKRPKRL